ncbi:MAG: PD-(D/E)XK nuclease family protein [Methylocystaceae bacterium]
MHLLLERLQEICTEYRWQEKLLLAPTRSQGHMLLEALARSGVPWLNLRPSTVSELAYMADQTDLRCRNLHLLGEIEQLRLLKQVINSLGDRQELNYFYHLYRLGKLEPWIGKSINELRLAGISADDLSRGQLGPKELELCKILSEYEGRLEEFSLVDQADLYRRAAALFDQNPDLWRDRRLLIPDQLELPWLAQELLQAIPASSRVYLPQVMVTGIKVLTRFQAFHSVDAESDQNNAFFQPIRLNETTVEIIPAYGRSNEIRTALRRILAAGLTLDAAVLCYTDTTAYARLAYSITEAAGIPAVFAAGIPVDATAPGRLCLQLLEWMESNYSAAVFHRLLMDGYLNQEFPGAVGRIWLDANAGRGKQDYLSGLQAWYTHCQERAGEFDQELQYGQILIDFCTNLLSAWGEPEDSSGVDFSVLCTGLTGCLKQFAGQESEADQEALAVLDEVLQQYASYFGQTVPLSHGLRLLKEIVAEQSVSVSGPRPGHLFVCHYSEAEWCGRENTFVVGLDADTFPGSGGQDPIILDEERKALSDKLPLKKQAANDKVYRLTRFLATRRGQLSLIYSCYDPSRFRSLLPSSLLLQVYRQISGDQEADYSRLQQALPLPENFLPRQLDQSLGDSEWWGCSWPGMRGTGEWNETLTACYPGTSRGLYAQKQRSSSAFTPFDGNLILNEQSALRTVSASSLEAAGRCPYAYFLRYILKLSPASDASADLGTWLDPLQMGSLLHEIYCRFGRRQAGSPRLPFSYLGDIALKVIGEWRALVPASNELAYITASDEIIKGLGVFYKLYHSADPASEPAFFEVPFGFGEGEARTAGAGIAAPIRIELPSGKTFNLRGRIDRIDRPLVGKGYQAWDYKTGGHSHYSERGYVKQGRQIQHLLYTLALQSILDQGLDPGAYVEKAGYLFPSRQGEGRVVIRLPEKRNQGMEAVSLLWSLITGGKYGCRHNDEECRYCDYRIVCRFPQGCEQMAMMIANDSNRTLQQWKELQAYE